jgi:adenylate kinase family enzyme
VKRVAVFGNAGGGKSTLARRLAELTGLPLHPLDLIQFEVGGAAVPHERYLKEHAELLRRDTWIIDGYGCRASAWERFAAADTLVYLDLPLVTHFAWVTKRLLQWRTPEGWPEGSPLVSSTLSSYRTILRCHRYLTPKYRELVTQAQHEKRVHHLKSPAEIASFLADVGRRAQNREESSWPIAPNR